MKQFNKFFKQLITLLLVITITINFIPNQVFAASKNFEFQYNKVTVSINSPAKTLISEAGKANNITKVKSCAYKGYDRTYEYKDFTLKTYSKTTSGKEFVSSIIITSSNVSTKENITIGCTKTQMIKAYGSGNERFGVYTFTKGKTKLVIELDDNDKVIKIDYMSK